MGNDDRNNFVFDDLNTQSGQGQDQETVYGKDTNSINSNYSGRTFDRRQYGGQGQDLVNGQYQAGTSGAEQAVNRYQSMGAAAAARQAYSQDYGNADATRGSQLDAMSLQQQAAYGNAPSQAAILGHQMVDQSLQAQMAGAAGARGGGLAQAAAMRQAAGNAAGFQANAEQSIAAQRAAEMAQARGEYMAGASGLRGQDLQQVGLQTQNEQFQRNLNQQGQQFGEQMAQGVNTAQLQAGLQANAQDQGQWATQGQFDQANQDRTLKVIGAGTSAGGGIIAGLGSDPRTKTSVTPLSSGDPYGQTDSSLYNMAARVRQRNADEERYDKSAVKGVGAGLQGMGEALSSDPNMKQTVVPLTEEPGTERHWDRDIRPSTASSAMGASLTAPMPRYAVRSLGEAAGEAEKARREMADNHPQKATRAERQMTADEMSAWADQQIASTRAAERRELAAGPAVGPMAQANRQLAPSSYTYRPEYTPADQAPGERNVGPMADAMARHPLTATMVERDPRTGMLAIDAGKAQRYSLGAIGSLQEQQDKTNANLARVAAMMQRERGERERPEATPMDRALTSNIIDGWHGAANAMSPNYGRLPENLGGGPEREARAYGDDRMAMADMPLRGKRKR